MATDSEFRESHRTEMSERTNQHFVPQFYFRLFSQGRPGICVLLTDSGRVICDAPIKGQCAKRNFYGSKELESDFSLMEANHSNAVKAALGIAWNPDAPFFSYDEYIWLLQGLLFQRARTAHQVVKCVPAMSAMVLRMFRDHLENIGKDELVAAIDAGEVSVSEENHASVARHISTALESVELILDLRPCFLLNHTDYPFIFSDAPVVFTNGYLRNVRHRGVVGLQSPGLQILWPLDSRTSLMLLDADKYQGIDKKDPRIHMFERSDVSQLNALQLHHSLKAVYFGDEADAEYVSGLWRSHRGTLKLVEAEFQVGRDWLLDGEPTETPIYQSFEPQPDYTLDLSFLQCNPIPANKYEFAYRSPQIKAEHEKWLRTKDAND